VELELVHIERLREGALFLACAVDHVGCVTYAEMVEEVMIGSSLHPNLIPAESLDADDLVVAVGFVVQGLQVTELLAVGDEFINCISLIESAMGRRVKAIYPLAAANVNALVPFLVGLQTGLPIIDADPMGRVLPLINQTTLNLAGVAIAPMAVVGATGESITLDVQDAGRAEKLVRVLASELGGWAATGLYPCTAGELSAHGVGGSLSRIMHIGEILLESMPTHEKYQVLTKYLDIRRIYKARVTNVEGLSRPNPPDQPAQPSSVTLADEMTGRIIRLEIQNEILMVMVDGSIEATVPDIITILHPSSAKVASLDDLWVGNRVDIVIFPGPKQWYTDAGKALAGRGTFIHAESGHRGI
jgi:DUF917 family protein